MRAACSLPILIITIVGMLPRPICAQGRGARIFEQVSGAVAWVESISTDSLHQYRGSGVVLKAQGVLITNFHVYRSGGALSARLGNVRLRLGNILCADAARDVLVVNILGTTPADAWKQVPALEYVKSDALSPGMDAYAIGNPRGVERTIGYGLVSGLRPNVMDSTQKLIQFSAPISEGNSGGALVDARGRLIGIPTLRFSDGGGQALNFALPMERMEEAMTDGRNDLPRDDAQWLRAWRSWRHGNCTTVLDTLGRVIGANGPNSITAAYLVGRCLQRAQDWPRARLAYESILTSDPLNASCLYRLGEVTLAQGDLAAAVELKSKAVRLDPSLAEHEPPY